jgi:putative ABC transport system permease protein
LPLAQLAAIKPSAIFRKEIGGGLRRAVPRVLLAVGLGLLTAVVILQLEDVATGLWFMGGVVGLVLVMTLLAHLALAGLARCEYSSLYLRQAVRSLSRPGNASRTVVVTLASALAVLFSIYLVEKNLRSAFIESYPPDAPNLFFLDIQKDQRQEFVEWVGGGAELFPVVRARLQAINDRTIDRRSEVERRGDSLAREFSLTYRDHLLDDEKLIAGQGLFGPAQRSSTLPPVSLLDSVVEIGDIKIGDILHFSIQGVSLKAEVASIRSRTKSMLYPFFYFVFPEQTLKAAPQTFFAALRVAEDQVGALENRMVRRFPNVSPINVGQSAAELGRLMAKLSLLVAFFASFSLFAGGLILVGSILATRLARLEEAVHYKILGADTAFVLKVFSLENVFLALLSCGAAVLVAEVGSWALCRLVLDILYRPHPLAALLLLAVVAILVLALGLITSLSVILKKPGSYLREQSS